MRLRFVHGTWGLAPPATRAQAVARIAAAGYDAVNVRCPDDVADARDAAACAASHGLAVVAALQTAGATPDEHLASVARRLDALRALSPLLVNVHGGSDFFGHADNVAVLGGIQRLAADAGLVVAHETHRGRATWSLPATLRLLDALPELRLTADISHWCTVHESLLAERRAELLRVADRCIHIHARVGHAQGPQAGDPAAPEWREALAAHLACWDAIVAARRAAGAALLTIHPEAGPPPYMPTLPWSGVPVADLAAVNAWMRDLLRDRYAAAGARG